MEANENTSTERCTLRYLVAQVVLAVELPMPDDIHTFSDGSVSMSLANVAEAEAWGHFLGAGVSPARVHSGKRWANVDGASWHGWYIQIHGDEPAEPDSGLDDDTTNALREVESTVLPIEEAPPRGSDAAEEHVPPPAEVDGYAPTGRAVEK